MTNSDSTGSDKRAFEEYERAKKVFNENEEKPVFIVYKAVHIFRSVCSCFLKDFGKDENICYISIDLNEVKQLAGDQYDEQNEKHSFQSQFLFLILDHLIENLIAFSINNEWKANEDFIKRLEGKRKNIINTWDKRKKESENKQFIRDYVYYLDGIKGYLKSGANPCEKTIFIFDNYQCVIDEDRYGLLTTTVIAGGIDKNKSENLFRVLLFNKHNDSLDDLEVKLDLAPGSVCSFGLKGEPEEPISAKRTSPKPNRTECYYISLDNDVIFYREEPDIPFVRIPLSMLDGKPSEHFMLINTVIKASVLHYHSIIQDLKKQLTGSLNQIFSPFE